MQDHETQIHARAMLLERTLLDFGYQVRVVQIDTGPVITQFEIELEAGLRVSRIMSLADDLAIALAVPSVRIVAPFRARRPSASRFPMITAAWSGWERSSKGWTIDRGNAASRCSWARTSRALMVTSGKRFRPFIFCFRT